MLSDQKTKLLFVSLYISVDQVSIVNQQAKYQLRSLFNGINHVHNAQPIPKTIMFGQIREGGRTFVYINILIYNNFQVSIIFILYIEAWKQLK